MLGLATALQLALVYGLKNSPVLENPYVPWLITFAPLYLVAVPAGLLLLRRLPAHRPEERALGAKRFASDAVIGVFLMYAGNLASVLVLSLIGALFDSQSTNPLEGIVSSDMLLLRILIPVIIAPLVEEYIFRRQLIDRLGIYGGKLAVVISALAFGLFHGNLFQFFYAFTLGLLFGYIYLHTGRLRYSVALHMLINFFGTVVAPWVLERADLENLDMDAIAAGTQSLTGAQTGFVLYILAVLLLAAAGFVLLCINARRIDYAPAEREIQRGKRFQTSYVNLGMLLLTLAALALTVYSTI
ncbi:MAG: CPBP family intramembrane metalloprotease [Oscillospiraceae bacterium]|nr:CPBP family intramembrane metalloprotease [Oscillospiraceae bacterium]